MNQLPHPRALELAALLLEAGADPNDSQAIYNKHFRPDDEHLKLLLRYGAGRDKGGPWLARQGDRSITPETLLVQELCWAAHHGYADRVTLLIDHGVNVDAPGPRNGRTAFEEARRAGHESIAQSLLERGAEKKELEPAERFALDLVAGREDAVRAQFMRDPGLIDRLGPHGRVELMHRVVDGGRHDAIRMATQIGLDINGMLPGTGFDRSVLHGAAAGGDVDLVRHLVALGADPSLRDPSHHATPQGWAEYHDQTEAAAYLKSLTASDFEAAVDAIVSGDAATLERLLRDHPELATARSARHHRSTLLHYVSANGVEDYRQKTPPNIVDITKMLLGAGADVNAESEAYGGGATTLGLVATSAHPEGAGVQIALMEALMQAGARMEQTGRNGEPITPVFACLANGQGDAARFFADHGAPLNLEEAAGVGRLDVVQGFFDETGARKDGTTREQMESGFLYACGYGHADVVTYLLERSVDPRTSNERGETGLHWALFAPHLAMVRALLDAGASLSARDGRGATPFDWAVNGLGTWPECPEREVLYEAALLLANAGATINPEWFDQREGRRRALEKVRADERLRALVAWLS